MDLPRIGLDLTEKQSAPGALAALERAEAHGVPMVWSTTGRGAPDATTLFAAAAVKTQRVGLGTAIVPTYPRHPTVLATQAMVIEQLAPGRLRLGVGPSHSPSIEGSLGIDMGRPLDHLREYVTVLRNLLWEGRADFAGQYYTVHSTIGQPAPVPIYVSALRQRAFQLAGEIADGAISWLCPVAYLRDKAAPAMRRGEALTGRPPARLVAHVPVVMSADRQTMLEAARQIVGGYARLPFYAGMFTDAGFPTQPGDPASDALLDHLVVWGTDEQVRDRLAGTLGGGIDELLVMLIKTGDPAREESRLSEIIVSIAGDGSAGR
ncbi:MAG TPA: LLM class flavin-dependent oxidoreductase [Thermomicrobiaceae bacterium]|nr:LLM class flavin-dependent oxidoreductase [Thermomicrobiaceae bacterium]